MVSFLKRKNIEVVVITVPIAESFIWSNEGIDENYKMIRSLTDKLDVKYYDFNLSKNRFELYSDSDSFNNSIHMSNSGADVFTKELCRVANLSDDEIRDLFYLSYDDVICRTKYKEIYDNKQSLVIEADVDAFKQQ